MKLCCLNITLDKSEKEKYARVSEHWIYPAINPEYISVPVLRLEDYYESISHCNCCQNDNESTYDNLTLAKNQVLSVTFQDIATQTASSDFLLASSESSSPILHHHERIQPRPAVSPIQAWTLPTPMQAGHEIHKTLQDEPKTHESLQAESKTHQRLKQAESKTHETLQAESKIHKTLVQAESKTGDHTQTADKRSVKARNVPLLERLVRTHPIWYIPNMGRDMVKNRLGPFPRGVFVLRQSGSREATMALSVRVHYAPFVEHYLIHSSKQGLQVNGSTHHFEHIPGLIEHYCLSADELPVKLQLPNILMESNIQELGTLSRLGQAFWTSPLVHRSRLHRTEFRTSIPSYKTQGRHQQPGRSGLFAQSRSCEDRQPVREIAVRRNHSAPAVDELSSLQLDRSFDPKRLSLTQINHSTLSPFQKIPPMQEVKEEVMVNFESLLKIDHQLESSHDYVNLPNSPDSIIHEVKAFQPIQTSHDNTMQSIMHELDFEINKLMVSVGGEPAALPTEKELTEKIKELSKTPENQQTEHVEKFAQTSQKRPTMMRQSSSRKHQATVFSFDFEQPPGSQDNLHENFVTKKYHVVPGHKHSRQKHLQQVAVSSGKSLKYDMHNSLNRDMHSTVISTKESSPLSPKSQYSSPAYCEPFDSLIGKVDGISATTPAFKVDDEYLRQKWAEKVKCRQGNSVKQQLHHVDMCSKPNSATLRSASQHTQQPLAAQNSNKVSTKHSQVFFNSEASNTQQEVFNYASKSVSKPGQPISINQPLDSNMASSPKYRISLEEIPLTSPKVSNKSSSGFPSIDLDNQRKKAERSVSLKTFDNPAPNEFSRARSLPRDTVDILRQEKHQTASKPPIANHGSLRRPTKSSANKLDVKRSSHERHVSSAVNSPARTYKPFPINDTLSDRNSLSESSTAEDFLYDTSPELTFKPSSELTRNNLLRISAYDNCHAQHCGSAVGSSWQNGAHSPHGKAEGSVVTQYCEPWDTSREHWTLLLHPSTVLPTITTMNRSKGEVMDTLGGAQYDTLDQSLAGMGVACSTLDWRNCENADSATETTPQPGPGDFEVEDEIETVSAIMERADAPISDDEGVELQPQMHPPLLVNGDSFPTNMKLCSQSAGKIQEHITCLANNKTSMFGVQVANFVECTTEGTEANPRIVLRNIRQFMSGIKNYLVQSGERELNRILEEEQGQLSQDEFLNVDALIEGALHKCVVKPLKRHIHRVFVDEYKSNGNLQQMHDSIQYARTKSPQQLGIKANLQPPQGTNLEVIKYFLQRMKRAYSPVKKLEHLLEATSCIINGVQCGEMQGGGAHDTVVSLGADDFLPMLIYVLVQAGVTTIEIEAEYMWGLLHPCLLAGEGGYYLTTLSSAVHLLKNLRTLMESAPGQVKIPCLGDMQGFIKIIIPDEKQDSIITKTLPVRPNMTTKDVCNMIAHKFKITNPQDYGLYIISAGTEEKLSDHRCPQDVKQTFSYMQQQCAFAYKRNNAKFVWPTNIRK